MFTSLYISIRAASVGGTSFITCWHTGHLSPTCSLWRMDCAHFSIVSLCLSNKSSDEFSANFAASTIGFCSIASCLLFSNAARSVLSCFSFSAYAFFVESRWCSIVFASSMAANMAVALLRRSYKAFIPIASSSSSFCLSLFSMINSLAFASSRALLAFRNEGVIVSDNFTLYSLSLFFSDSIFLRSDVICLNCITIESALA